MYNLDNRLRGLLCSWKSFYFLMSLGFLEGVPKWSGNNSNLSHASWFLCPIQSLWGYLLLLPGLRLPYRSSGGASFWKILLVKISLWWKGFQNPWSDRFYLYRGVFSLPYFSLSHDGEGLDRLSIIPKFPNFIGGSPNFLGCFPSLLHDFYFNLISSCSVRSRG